MLVRFISAKPQWELPPPILILDFSRSSLVAQQVKDLSGTVTAVAQVWFLAEELPYAANVAKKKKRRLDFLGGNGGLCTWRFLSQESNSCHSSAHTRSLITRPPGNSIFLNFLGLLLCFSTFMTFSPIFWSVSLAWSFHLFSCSVAKFILPLIFDF